jgi:hypothetical protein
MQQPTLTRSHLAKYKNHISAHGRLTASQSHRTQKPERCSSRVAPRTPSRAAVKASSSANELWTPLPVTTSHALAGTQTDATHRHRIRREALQQEHLPWQGDRGLYLGKDGLNRQRRSRKQPQAKGDGRTTHGSMEGKAAESRTQSIWGPCRIKSHGNSPRSGDPSAKAKGNKNRHR